MLRGEWIFPFMEPASCPSRGLRRGRRRGAPPGLVGARAPNVPAGPFRWVRGREDGEAGPRGAPERGSPGLPCVALAKQVDPGMSGLDEAGYSATVSRTQ